LRVYTPIISIQQTERERIRHLAGTCLFNKIRRVSRAVTSEYSAHFEALPITAAQSPILTRLYLGGSVTITVLAEFLALDRTTLARNLKPLEAQGFVVVVPGPEDTRERVVSISAAGVQALEQVLPYWEQAHEAVSAKLGADSATNLFAILAAADDRLG
jgi:DNA-binding MarR family transcriptional regulator